MARAMVTQPSIAPRALARAPAPPAPAPPEAARLDRDVPSHPRVGKDPRFSSVLRVRASADPLAPPGLAWSRIQRLTATRVSSPSDPSEREAVAVAKQIVSMPDPTAAPSRASGGVAQRQQGPTPGVLRSSGKPRGVPTPVAARRPAIDIARASRRSPSFARTISRASGGGGSMSPGVASEIGAAGRGAPLPRGVRSFMEPRFRAGFGNVGIHTGAQAARLSKKLNAHAFTLGDQIFFGQGRFSPDTDGGRELIAHELTHTIQQGAAPQHAPEAPVTMGGTPMPPAHQGAAVHRSADVTVTQQSAPQVQRSLLSEALDYFADKANFIPGFRMFTIVLGMNPINMSPVERSAANILRAVVEFMPGGALITQALDKYGVFDKAGAFIEQQIASLGLTWGAIKEAITTFIGTLGVSDVFHLGDVWERAKRIFSDPIERIKALVVTVAKVVIQFVKDAILRPLAELASQTAGWDLLCAVLGKNPITGDAVPRTAETLIGGFMKLIGQEEIWENIKKGNAIARAYAWFQTALEGLMGFVREIPSLFINAVKSLEITDIIVLPLAFVKVGRAFAGFAARFFDWAGNTIWDLLEIIFSVVAPSVIVYLKKARAAFKKILQDPIGFVGNLVRAGKQGFNQFASNFVTHLKASLIAWITGPLSEAGVYIPKAFSLVEIGKCVLSVLGITWPQIRGKIVKALGPNGETIMKVLETGFEIVKALVTGGPAAAWEVIKQKLADLSGMVKDAIISYVKDRIITKAVTMLVSLLNPAGAFIQAIIAIYNGVMAFVERLKTIAQVVAAFIDSISEIANGNTGPAANKVEQTLAGLLTLVISFLARIVGLGNVSAKVIELLTKLRAKVDAALEKAITWIIERAKALFKSLFGKKDKPDTRTDAEKKRDKRAGIADAEKLVPPKGFDEQKVRGQLGAIKSRYKLLTLELVVDSKKEKSETIHFSATASDEEKGDPKEVSTEAGAAELATAKAELTRLEDKLIRALNENKKKPTRDELDNLEALMKAAAEAAAGKSVSKNELSRFKTDKGVAARMNLLNLGKARLQDAENIGGEAEHTKGARKGLEEGHQEGLRKKGEQKGRAREDLLGGRAEGEGFRRLVAAFGLSSEEEETASVRWYESAERGVSVSIGRGTLEAIQLFSAEHPDFDGFAEPLPLGLNYEMTRVEVRERLGDPDHVTPPRRVSPSLGHAGIDRYRAGDCTVVITYSSTTGRIEVLGFESSAKSPV